MTEKKFRTLSEIEADRNAREREQFKKRISTDARDIFEDFFGKSEPKGEPDRKPKKSKFWAFVRWGGAILLIILILDIILGLAWLLKIIISDLF